MRLDHILIAAVAGIGETAVADTVVVAGIAAVVAAAVVVVLHMIFAGFGHCSTLVQSARRSQSLSLQVQTRMYQH